MRILYISTLCAKKTYGELFGYNTASPGFAVQKYHRVMAEGFKDNGTEVICVTAPPISKVNYKGKKATLPECTENGIRFSYVDVLNLPIIKNLSVYRNTKKRCLELLNEAYRQGTDAGIVLDLLCISACQGALAAQKKFNKKHKVKSAGIVTDLPAFLHTDKTGLKGKIFGKLFTRLFNKNLRSCSSYVFLTEQMNRLLNVQNKPYAVIEGQADINVPSPKVTEEKKAPRICMYAGSLCKIYGIVTLAEAFGELSLENAELHIYGNGDSKEELEALSKKYSSVKYCGVLSNEEIVAKEQEAILLINPRPAGEEYTKYSFPSKNMEYMASGTAVLTTNLPGMPAEYHDYVYVLHDESKDGIKRSLSAILSLSDPEIRSKGMKAREFVLENKNSKIQSGKVLTLLK